MPADCTSLLQFVAEARLPSLAQSSVFGVRAMAQSARRSDRPFTGFVALGVVKRRCGLGREFAASVGCGMTQSRRYRARC